MSRESDSRDENRVEYLVYERKFRTPGEEMFYECGGIIDGGEFVMSTFDRAEAEGVARDGNRLVQCVVYNSEGNMLAVGKYHFESGVKVEGVMTSPVGGIL